MLLTGFFFKFIKKKQIFEINCFFEFGNLTVSIVSPAHMSAHTKMTDSDIPYHNGHP
jgi:hypothetical protein